MSEVITAAAGDIQQEGGDCSCDGPGCYGCAEAHLHYEHSGGDSCRLGGTQLSQAVYPWTPILMSTDLHFCCLSPGRQMPSLPTNRCASVMCLVDDRVVSVVVCSFRLACIHIAEKGGRRRVAWSAGSMYRTMENEFQFFYRCLPSVCYVRVLQQNRLFNNISQPSHSECRPVSYDTQNRTIN